MVTRAQDDALILLAELVGSKSDITAAAYALIDAVRHGDAEDQRDRTEYLRELMTRAGWARRIMNGVV